MFCERKFRCGLQIRHNAYRPFIFEDGSAPKPKYFIVIRNIEHANLYNEYHTPFLITLNLQSSVTKHDTF